MSPRYLRYRFPADDPDTAISAERRARTLATLWLAIPPEQLQPSRLDSEAVMLVDRGSCDMAIGEPMGEELAPWLRLVVGPGGRSAWLDCDVDEMARVQAVAKRETRNLQNTGHGSRLRE